MASTVLYERDILEKQHRIREMEKRLSCLESPKVVYKSEQVWQETYARYTDTLADISSDFDDAFHRCHHAYGAITDSDMILRLEKAFLRVSHNQEWSVKQTGEAVMWLESIMDTIHLPSINAFRVLKARFSVDISDIPIYQCKSCCTDPDSYISEDGECYHCENKSLELIRLTELDEQDQTCQKSQS